MAKKEPETRNRYAIIAETTLEQTGFVLAAVTKMVGIENVRCELITDVLRFKDRKVHEVNATDFAAEFVKANPRFMAAALAAHFKEAGRAPNTAYYALRKLTDANVIRKSGDEFVRVEALPAPASGRGQNSSVQYEVPNRDLIAKAIKGRKQFTMRELRDLFEREGRNEKSISPILTKMTADKLIKNVSTGQYVVLAKGTKPTASAKKPAAKKKPPPPAEASAPAAPSMMNGGDTAHG